jgi:8-oxo-dGTP pyrophosphatase MutT (NUDIX family)
VDLLSIERALAAHRPRDPGDLLVRERAAVAAVLRFDRRAAEVLLVERAHRAGDRWSGHVALPGGLAQPDDGDLLATAIRETREETGIDLHRARHLGRLGAVRAPARGRLGLMTITPHVFHLADDQPVVLDHEATAWFWLPLDRAARGELDARHRLGRLPLRFRAWCWQGHTVWGLTLGMLSELIRVVRDPR